MPIQGFGVEDYFGKEYSPCSFLPNSSAYMRDNGIALVVAKQLFPYRFEVYGICPTLGIAREFLLGHVGIGIGCGTILRVRGFKKEFLGKIAELHGRQPCFGRFRLFF